MPGLVEELYVEDFFLFAESFLEKKNLQCQPRNSFL